MYDLNRAVERNLRGIQLEKDGQTDAAALLYEANVQDGFDGDHPYNRLRVIYTRKKDLRRALAICERAVPALRSQPHKAERFQAEAAKLRVKIAKAG